MFKESSGNKEHVYGIMPITPTEELHKKIIRPDFQIDLDVFQYKDTHPNSFRSNTTQVRSFVKNESVTESDREIIA